MSVKGEARSTKSDPNSVGKTPKSAQRRVMQRVVDTWNVPMDKSEPAANKKPYADPVIPTGVQPPLRARERDPFGCTCGPCKRFWKDNFHNVSILEEPVLQRAQKTSTMFRPEQADWRIKKGDRVIVDGKQTGVVQFVGLLDENVIAPPVYVGVRCDENIGSTHNGVMNEKRYFHCSRGHGALVPYTDVRPLNPPEKRPELTGNFMFDSYQEVIKQRALRRQKMEASEEQAKPKPTRPASRLKKTVTCYDENDVAYKDVMTQENLVQDSQREGGHQVYHYANTTVKIRTGGAPKIKVDPQARRFAKWKEEFGGGERGEKLVKTLKKLHEALNMGREVDENEEEVEEIEEPEKQTSERQSVHAGSKPPTRQDGYNPRSSVAR